MDRQRAQTIVVTGATGRQGGAVARHLLQDGWRVRALTRKPAGPRARALADVGAEVVRADMADPASLTPTFAGAYGVFSVQNTMTSGVKGEIEQGRHVADAAKAAGVSHLVYGSSGTGEKTGIPSWDSKLVVEDHIRDLALPVTVLRPKAFMELMTDKDLYPAVAVWSVMPRVMGWDRALPWLAADDVGAVTARVLAEPERFIGADLDLSGDVRTVEECRAAWVEVTGRRPRGFPMPTWLFRRVAGDDLPTMWEWLRTGTVPLDPGPTRAIHPGALTVREWVARVAATKERRAGT